MKNKILGVTLMSLSAVSMAGEWINMDKKGSEKINNNFTQCFYKQVPYGNFSTSITIAGNQFSCPRSIKYNPVTNKWRKKGF